MLKKIVAFVALMYAAVSFAAVDVNKANAAELDSVKGVGPALSKKILDARKAGNFKDWNDFMARVSGVKEAKATKLSAEGLTVDGTSFNGAAPAKKDGKAAHAKEAAPAKAAASAPAKSSKK